MSHKFGEKTTKERKELEKLLARLEKIVTKQKRILDGDDEELKREMDDPGSNFNKLDRKQTYLQNKILFLREIIRAKEAMIGIYENLDYDRSSFANMYLKKQAYDPGEAKEVYEKALQLVREFKRLEEEEYAIGEMEERKEDLLKIPSTGSKDTDLSEEMHDEKNKKHAFDVLRQFVARLEKDKFFVDFNDPNYAEQKEQLLATGNELKTIRRTIEDVLRLEVSSTGKKITIFHNLAKENMLLSFWDDLLGARTSKELWQFWVGQNEASFHSLSADRLMEESGKKAYLDDETINAFLFIMREKMTRTERDRNFFLKTQVAQYLFQEGGNKKAREKTLREMQSNIRENGFGPDKNIEYIMPININNNHWVFMRIHQLQEPRNGFSLLMDYFDSDNSSVALTDNQLALIANFMKAQRPYETEAVFPLVVQSDPVNCGVFLCLFTAILFSPVDVEMKDRLLRQVMDATDAQKSKLAQEMRYHIYNVILFNDYRWDLIEQDVLSPIRSVEINDKPQLRLTQPLGAFTGKQINKLEDAIIQMLNMRPDRRAFETSWRQSEAMAALAYLSVLSEKERAELTEKLVNAIFPAKTRQNLSTLKERIHGALLPFILLQNEDEVSKKLSAFPGERLIYC